MDYPTRTEQVVEKIMGNHGMSITQAMKEAGYSDNYAHNPQELTATKRFQKILEAHGITDELLAKRHLWLLNKDEYKPVAAGLDMAYKLKGAYANNLNGTNIQNNVLVLPSEVMAKHEKIDEV